jgi:hypothetical protein
MHMSSSQENFHTGEQQTLRGLAGMSEFPSLELHRDLSSERPINSRVAETLPAKPANSRNQAWLRERLEECAVQESA